MRYRGEVSRKSSFPCVCHPNTVMRLCDRPRTCQGVFERGLDFIRSREVSPIPLSESGVGEVTDSYFFTIFNASNSSEIPPS